MHQAGLCQLGYNKNNKNKEVKHYEKIKQKRNQGLFKSNLENL